MNDSPNASSTAPDKGPGKVPGRRGLFSRVTVMAFLSGAILAGAATALAGGTGMACRHGMFSGSTTSAADISAHVDHVLKHLYVEVDASEAQQTQIAPLVQQALGDLLPLRDQLRAAHTQLLAAMTASTIDRTALEGARAEHLQLADQASKRVVQLIADVGDVLTPAQRTALAARLTRTHGGGDM